MKYKNISRFLRYKEFWLQVLIAYKNERCTEKGSRFRLPCFIYYSI